MAARILLLPGMTPSARVFDPLLPHLSDASVMSWIEPLARESIESYSKRLAKTIEGEPPWIVCGVSFGGIVAQELAGHLKSRACVLVSSVRTARDFPPWFRCARWAPRPCVDPCLRTIGGVAARWPRAVRTRGTARLRKLVGDEGAWYRWAAASALRWQGSARSSVPTVQIHGDRDRTFPIRYLRPDVVLEGGGHVVTLTHAERIAGILRDLVALHDGTLPDPAR